MALAIYGDKGIHYPVLTCDTCGQPIQNAEEAMVGWTKPVDAPISHINSIFHRVKCDPGKKGLPLSDDLSRYMRHLIRNLHMGKIVSNGSTRQLVIDLPEPDDFLEVIGRPLM